MILRLWGLEDVQFVYIGLRNAMVKIIYYKHWNTVQHTKRNRTVVTNTKSNKDRLILHKIKYRRLKCIAIPSLCTPLALHASSTQYVLSIYGPDSFAHFFSYLSLYNYRHFGNDPCRSYTAYTHYARSWVSLHLITLQTKEKILLRDMSIYRITLLSVFNYLHNRDRN